MAMVQQWATKRLIIVVIIIPGPSLVSYSSYSALYSTVQRLNATNLTERHAPFCKFVITDCGTENNFHAYK